MRDLIAISKKTLGNAEIGMHLSSNLDDKMELPEMQFYPKDTITLSDYEYVDVCVLFHSVSHSDNIILEYSDTLGGGGSPAKTPMTPMRVPDYANRSQLKSGEIPLRDVISWNVANAICSMRHSYTVEPYIFGLSQGLVSIPDMAEDLLGLKLGDHVSYSVRNHCHTYGCNEHCVIYCHYCADGLQDTPYKGSYVYVPYDSLRKYCNAINCGFYKDVYERELTKDYSVYNTADDRIKRPFVLLNGVNMYKESKYDEFIL